MRRAAWTSILVLILILTLPQTRAYAWSNGGYSADPNNPDYGTHDWIAQHALDWLPAEKKQYITDNLPSYLFGTELPDLPSTQGGIGDTTKHHIYYSSTGALQDDAAAKRAEAEYQAALTYLNAANYPEAAKHSGAMTHYIADVAVFGHVMGASTDWGTEVHHPDYENHVNGITSTYSATYIKPLQFDGALTTLSAGDATRQLALDTTLDGGQTYTAKWMDQNYNWTSTTFTERSWESVNYATNDVADVLSTLYDAYTLSKTPTTITCLASKTNAKENEQITISGTINADISATITIHQKVSDNWATLTTTTSTHGAYSAPITLAVGSYTIKATWTGDPTYEGATSTQIPLSITPRTGTLKITTTDEKNTPLSGATITTKQTPTGQAPLQATTATDGTTTFSDARIGNYTINASKTGYKANTTKAQVADDQSTTRKIVLTKNSNDIPGYPIEVITLGIALFLGYFILFKTNSKNLDKS
ncbi:MAG: carboxypeptidase regulatory-like domain-containing protein [Candidatus Bathyarchaeota archaeon]|nr:carboxypeptidase regulatory-like domain-containing protein [Candidatus Bathyarchaeota archaeon]